MKILTVLTSDDGLGDTGRKTGSRLEGFAVQRMRDCSYSEAVNEAVVGRGHGLRSGFLPGRTRSSMGSCRGSPVDRLDRNDIRGRKTRRKNQPCFPYVRYALTPDGTPFVIGKSDWLLQLREGGSRVDARRAAVPCGGLTYRK